MERMQVICSSCSGIGTTYIWKEATKDAETGIGTLKRKEIPCKACNGKGYTEYAVFSIEEAEAILNHCGLSTESEEVNTYGNKNK